VIGLINVASSSSVRELLTRQRTSKSFAASTSRFGMPRLERAYLACRQPVAAGSSVTTPAFSYFSSMAYLFQDTWNRLLDADRHEVIAGSRLAGFVSVLRRLS
jgi:hypothetical protein